MAGLAKRVAQPLETLVQTVTRGRASRLDVLYTLLACRSIKQYFAFTYPSTLSEAVQTKLVGNLGSVHGVLSVWLAVFCPPRPPSSKTYGQILLVGENQEESIPQLVLVQHALKLLAGLDNTIAIVAVNDEDDTLRVLEVMPPQRTDLVLASDIPHGELNVLVLDSLHVEPCKSDCQRSARIVVTMRGATHQ